MLLRAWRFWVMLPTWKGLNNPWWIVNPVHTPQLRCTPQIWSQPRVFLCLKYQGDWMILDFMSAGPGKLSWRHCFHSTGSLQTKGEGSVSWASAWLHRWLLGTEKQGAMPGPDNDSELCATWLPSTGKGLLRYARLHHGRSILRQEVSWGWLRPTEHLAQPVL